MSDQKILIALTPYDAIHILSFMREFVHDGNKHEPDLASIHETLDNFQAAVACVMTPEMLNEVDFNAELNHMIGKVPQFQKFIKPE